MPRVARGPAWQPRCATPPAASSARRRSRHPSPPAGPRCPQQHVALPLRAAAQPRGRGTVA
eukprot:12406474-Karenia_brevis.AAC.1